MGLFSEPKFFRYRLSFLSAHLVFSIKQVIDDFDEVVGFIPINDLDWLGKFTNFHQFLKYCVPPALFFVTYCYK